MLYVTEINDLCKPAMIFVRYQCYIFPDVAEKPYNSQTSSPYCPSVGPPYSPWPWDSSRGTVRTRHKAACHVHRT